MSLFLSWWKTSAAAPTQEQWNQLFPLVALKTVPEVGMAAFRAVLARTARGGLVYFLTFVLRKEELQEACYQSRTASHLHLVAPEAPGPGAIHHLLWPHVISAQAPHGHVEQFDTRHGAHPEITWQWCAEWWINAAQAQQTWFKPLRHWDRDEAAELGLINQKGFSLACVWPMLTLVDRLEAQLSRNYDGRWGPLAFDNVYPAVKRAACHHLRAQVYLRCKLCGGQGHHEGTVLVGHIKRDLKARGVNPYKHRGLIRGPAQLQQNDLQKGVECPVIGLIGALTPEARKMLATLQSTWRAHCSRTTQPFKDPAVGGSAGAHWRAR